jgi:hypothetical protein
MNFIQRLAPAPLFTFFAYNMFCFLFNWDHRLWVKWRKPKYFQFTPRPLSSKLILHWAKIIRNNKLCVFDHDAAGFNNNTTATNDGKRHRQHSNVRADGSAGSFEVSVADIGCPIAVVDGANDSLVDGVRLRNDLRANPEQLCYFDRVPGFEHMDLLWSRDAKQLVYEPLLKVFAAVQEQPTRCQDDQAGQFYVHQQHSTVQQ